MPDLPGVTLPVPVVRALEPGRKVTVGPRPQNFGPDGDVPLRLGVDVIENLGGVAYAYASLPGTPDPFCIEMRGKPGAGTGRVETRFASDTALLFDPETGARLR